VSLHQAFLNGARTYKKGPRHLLNPPRRRGPPPAKPEYPLQSSPLSGYVNGMANPFEPQASMNPDDEAEMLAAIDEGIADADAGRVTPVEEAKKKISQWITESSSPTVR
jgi:hypothetical protein